MITEDQVRRALTRQTSELLYEVVRWSIGRFTFTVGAENPAATKAALGMEPARWSWKASGASTSGD